MVGATSEVVMFRYCRAIAFSRSVLHFHFFHVLAARSVTLHSWELIIHYGDSSLRACHLRNQ